MTRIFSADFFTNNRTQLRKTLRSDATIIVTGNGSMQRQADEPFRFVQDSNFWYLTGLNTPDLVLVIGVNETFLIAPSLSLERETFDGAIDLQALASQSGITDIVGEREGWQRVKNELDKNPLIATLGSAPSFDRRYRMHTLPYRRRLLTKLKRLQPALQTQDIRMDLAHLRMIKQPIELQALQRAIDITSETLIEITEPSLLKTIEHEYELEAAITYGFRRRGADGHAFEPIVGAGVDGTTLHHIHNDNPVRDGDLIVLDIGAGVEHYAADITRTVVRGRANDRQRAIFDAVASVQQYALSLLKPGTLLREYEHRVVDRVGKELVSLGLIASPSEDAIRHYFPHATSHFLGLDTHDVGDYSQALRPGMVLTCEPGIYIPEEGIGVRLEDDVLITESGHTVMSDACPRTLGSVQ